jgi:hypothetical protein
MELMTNFLNPQDKKTDHKSYLLFDYQDTYFSGRRVVELGNFEKIKEYAKQHNKGNFYCVQLNDFYFVKNKEIENLEIDKRTKAFKEYCWLVIIPDEGLGVGSRIMKVTNIKEFVESISLGDDLVLVNNSKYFYITDGIFYGLESL